LPPLNISIAFDDGDTLLPDAFLFSFATSRGFISPDTFAAAIFFAYASFRFIAATETRQLSGELSAGFSPGESIRAFFSSRLLRASSSQPIFDDAASFHYGAPVFFAEDAFTITLCR
jgi:hypothetical protein